MTRFVDKYLSARIQGWPVDVAPMFSTQIAAVDSGAEQVNRRWQDPLREINIPQGVRDYATFLALQKHWLLMGGPANTWPWRDPTDFASVDLEIINQVPTVAGDDQVIGTGDGITVAFQLIKTYQASPAADYVRDITLPVLSTVIVLVDGVDPATLSPPLSYTVSRPGGVVTFDTPPAVAAVISAGYLFDLNVRFDSDDTFRAVMQTYSVSGFSDVPLREVRYCEDD